MTFLEIFTPLIKIKPPYKIKIKPTYKPRSKGLKIKIKIKMTKVEVNNNNGMKELAFVGAFLFLCV